MAAWSIVLAHALWALGLARLMHAYWAALVGAAGCSLVYARLCALRIDRRRSAWITRLIDEPMFCHFAALLGMLVLAPFAAAALTSRRAQGWLALLGDTALASYALGLALAAWATWVTRRRLCVRRITVKVAGLAPEFDGFRIVQLSDLHIGSFDSSLRGRTWIARANELGADLAVVTGDLVTSGAAFYGEVSALLAELHAPQGVFLVLGNHDQWDEVELTRLLRAQRLSVLKNECRLLTRASAQLAIAGLDDVYSKRANLAQALAGVPAGVPCVLLSHYPDAFEAAAAAGVDLVLAGHTHGGQLAVPFLAEQIHMGQLVGFRGRGLHTLGASTLYVNAGLGTTVLPMRLGVPPELALIELKASTPSIRHRESTTEEAKPAGAVCAAPGI